MNRKPVVKKDKIARVDLRQFRLADLKDHPENPRIHPASGTPEWNALKASLGNSYFDPIVVNVCKGKNHMVLVSGHLRRKVLIDLGYTAADASTVNVSDAEHLAMMLAANKQQGQDDDVKLAPILFKLQAVEGFNVQMTGFTVPEVSAICIDAGLMAAPTVTEDEAPIDRAKELQKKWKVKRGDVFACGRHRVMCGDSVRADDVRRLMGDTRAILLHADPPYGMGKESEGIANDNLYREKLDRFQMEWWAACRPVMADNASAYIWGTDEDLWRLWYVGGLQASERMTIRNEIVWSKGAAGAGGISHMGAEGLRQYPNSTERCLFFMLGEQGFNNNADNYWEGWEKIRSALEADCKKMGWGAKDIDRICGVGMYGHWFTKSQWSFIPEEHYKKLQAAARAVKSKREHDAFKREHDDLKREHDDLKREHDDLKREFYSTRSPFDNTHENMTDVWTYPRVIGADRWGHATPKPVAMIARAVKSSAPEGAAVLEPFLGSGTTMIACEQTGRIARGMEIDPGYTAVILERFATFTGQTPKLVR